MSVQEIYDILREIEQHYSGMEHIWAKTNVREEYAGFDA
jgi:hypothetical protein